MLPEAICLLAYHRADEVEEPVIVPCDHPIESMFIASLQHEHIPIKNAVRVPPD